MTEALVVLVTVPSRELGEDIAAKLVTERLAACVNVLGPIRSVYRWNDEICRDDEHLLVIKTGRERYLVLEQQVRALHPYSVPEVIALPVEAGSQAYLSWISDETR
jgi:periplasmic divalent cation tolerance protein